MGSPSDQLGDSYHSPNTEWRTSSAGHYTASKFVTAESLWVAPTNGSETETSPVILRQQSPLACWAVLLSSFSESKIMITINLTGKVAVVTGSGQGLGKATARMLHAAGATVVINYLDDSHGIGRGLADETVAEFGERCFSVDADVRSRDDLQRMFARVQSTAGNIDYLVNNAAILKDRTMKNMTDSDWNDVVETNLSSVFKVCQTAQPFLNDGGRIVNMASISGVIGFFGQANYASAKAGVIALTKVLSKELAGRRINVNAVAPGVVLTEMGKSIPEQARQHMLSQIPLKRFGEPEEIASTILFLCSDLSSYLTGQTLHVNGGWWA